jgi:hypothetical protein
MVTVSRRLELPLELHYAASCTAVQNKVNRVLLILQHGHYMDYALLVVQFISHSPESPPDKKKIGAQGGRYSC